MPLAEAASFDLQAIERSARVAATEAAAAGIHWTFAPMVDLTRDPRCGRVNEGAGEVPYLAARIAAARVKGLQGRQRGDTDAVLATAKHFAGYGATVGGREYDSVEMSLRQLWETHLPPFQTACDAGAASFTNAFNDPNGVPATGNRYLLRDILEGAWGFEGMVVSDWASIGEMVAHGHAEDVRHATEPALNAGTGIDMESHAYRQVLPALVERALKTIAFIGPLVKAHKDHHGAWAVTLPEVDYERFIVSPWEGLQQRLDGRSQLLYAQGCGIEGTRRDGFAEAVPAASAADLVIASVAESAAMSGEARSRIGLPGVQEELLQAPDNTGKPLVVLVDAGRPLVFDWTAEHAHAVLYSWWLGSEAGHAIADVLCGDHNPAARLPMSFPRHEGQIPVYHTHFSAGRSRQASAQVPWAGAHIDVDATPAYPFGHGLSYAQFAYADLQLDRRRPLADETWTVTMRLTNTGPVAGDEVVQLYLRDRAAAAVRPMMELEGFQRVHLQPGESRELCLVIDRASLAFVNDSLQRGVEPGWCDPMLGSSSVDIRLRAAFEVLA